MRDLMAFLLTMIFAALQVVIIVLGIQLNHIVPQTGIFVAGMLLSVFVLYGVAMYAMDRLYAQIPEYRFRQKR